MSQAESTIEQFGEDLRITVLDRIRIRIPDDEVAWEGTCSELFDILPNSTGLTEEFLYLHQPSESDRIDVYSTSPQAIGELDDTAEIRDSFSVIDQTPVIIVARKGYAGRLYVVDTPKLIVHEDAYAIRPKPKHAKLVNLYWFAGHYSAEFQSRRTSLWGIGDFPRTMFKSMKVKIPAIDFQNEAAELYIRRQRIVDYHKSISRTIESMLAEEVQRLCISDK